MITLLNLCCWFSLSPSFYVQWVTTGALECAEGGGHYRPNHHARLGQDMFRALEWTMEEDYGQERLRTILARKLQPLLPSFSEAFTQSVPLTRIRDIAHRNDLPHVSLWGEEGSGGWGQKGESDRDRGVRRLGASATTSSMLPG